MKKQLNYKSLNTLGDVDITQSVVPGGGTAESTIEYLDLRGVDNSMKPTIIMASQSVKLEGSDVSRGVQIITTGMYMMKAQTPELVTAISIDMQMPITKHMSGEGSQELTILNEGFGDMVASIPRITKEQFYKLPVALKIYFYYSDAMEHQDEMKITFDTLWAIWERDGVEGQYLDITIPNADIASVTEIIESTTSTFNITSIMGEIFTSTGEIVTRISFNESNDSNIQKIENLITGEITYVYESMG